MRVSNFILVGALFAAEAILNSAFAPAQDSPALSNQDGSTSGGAAPVLGHPFSAIKYARQVKILANGKEQFIRNERYPTQIARDEQGRLRMEDINQQDLLPECDHLEIRNPPVCPVWSFFVIDPIAQAVFHWNEGERQSNGVVLMPISQDHLERALRETSEMPDLPPDIDTGSSSVTTTDLGEKTIAGITARGVRTTVVYPAGNHNNAVILTIIHEVWTAPDMKLIVRVVDGDPQGEETVWGLEKISLHPDPELFQLPAAKEVQKQNSDKGAEYDFAALRSWFAK